MTKTLPALLLAAAIAALPALPAMAQAEKPLTNVVPEAAHVTLQAKIAGINLKTREITLQSRAGERVKMKVGPAVRLELLKTGEIVNAEYYRSIAFFVTPPGASNAAPTNTDEIAAAMARPVNAPGGAAVMLTKVSGIVVGIDLGTNSLQVIDPAGGRVHTVTVTDPQRIAALPKLKIGDTITAVISESMAIRVDAAK